MSAGPITLQALLAENAELRARLEETEETLRAIRTGEVDTLVVEGEAGPQVFVLQRSEAESNRFRSDILARVSDAVIAIDDARRVVYFNAAAEKQYDVSASAVLGRPLSDIYENQWVRPEDQAEAEAALCETGHWRGKSIHHKRNGGVIHVESSVSRLVAKDGTPVGRLGVIRDITDASAAEEALRTSQARMDAILRSALVAIITMDHEGNLVEFNPAAERIFGYTRDEALGQPLADLIIPAPLREAHRKDLATYLGTRCGPVLNRQIELNALRADGSQFPAELAIIPIAGIDPPLFTAFLQDITERKKNEEALRAQAADMARADRSKDEFLAMLAHELRNPLAPLRNAAEILREAAVASKEWMDAQRVIDRQLENMSRMVDDLLDISRITEGKIELHRAPVDLRVILTAAAELARPGCLANGQTFELVLPSEPVFLHADSTRLEQVFGNLLSNACKYAGDGCRIVLEAERSTEAGASEAIVRVRDDGVGIAPDLLPRIFDLFVQATRSLDRAHGGLGIGLALVKRLVRLHGGSVEASSRGLGHGTEFIVRLPTLNEVPTPVSLAALAAPGPIETPRRILIVDDNADSARTLAILQSRRGHQTRVAFTGPAAVAVAEEFRPEIVLLDIGLPGMDGFEVARRLRATPGLEETSLVAMSGYGRQEDRENARRAGFDEYLVKPVNLDLIRSWLHEGRARRADAD